MSGPESLRAAVAADLEAQVTGVNRTAARIYLACQIELARPRKTAAKGMK